jgi:AraC-like DNA-binding protein
MKYFYKYLPVTETEKKWGFYITSAGYNHINPKEIYPSSGGHPSTHVFTWNKGRILDGYYLVFIGGGEGIFESAVTTPHMITAGNCFFLFPDVGHRYKPNLNTGWEEYWIGFNGTYPRDLMSKDFFTPQNPFVEMGLHEPLLILFRRLLETVQTGSPGYHQIISGVALEILGLVFSVSMYREQKEDLANQLVEKAMFILRESLEEPVNVQQMARELPMGYSKFRKEFKRVVGLSPHEYHLMLRLEKAKELLLSTNLNINEIAYQTGFDSVFYFSRLFKKKTGQPPTFYRKQASRHALNNSNM